MPRRELPEPQLSSVNAVSGDAKPDDNWIVILDCGRLPAGVSAEDLAAAKKYLQKLSLFDNWKSIKVVSLVSMEVLRMRPGDNV